jgi:hypothetical protein
VQVRFAPAGSEDFQPVGAPVAVDAATRSFTVDVTPEAGGSYRFDWSPPAAPVPPRTGLGGLQGPKPQPSQPPVYRSLVAPVTVG